MESGSIWGLTFIFAVLPLIIIIIYFLPSIFAFQRGHPNRWMIFVVNLMTAWTGIAWVFALIWAFQAIHISKDGSHGGESGANIFVNDEKKVRLVNAAATGGDDASAQILRLKGLLDDGLITQDEFQRLKAKVVY